MRINYLIATWSGKRRNPSQNYLKDHLKHLNSLKHNIDQITIIRPLGSDDDEFYNLDGIDVSKIVLLERPENDRSYGQFFYAYKQYTSDFDYYMLVEDDYIPNLDNFDTILIDLLKQKKCDYLCGKYGRRSLKDIHHPMQNIGIIAQKAFEKILFRDPSPLFYKNGENDGQEQIMFADLFLKNNLIIKDYSNEYSIPYYDKYLTFFSCSESKNTLFVPYQFLFGKAFHYHANDNSFSNFDSHFLSTINITFSENNFIICDLKFKHSEPQLHFNELMLGSGYFSYINGRKYVIFKNIPQNSKILATILDRLCYESRETTLYFKFKNNPILFDEIKKNNWSIVTQKNNMFEISKQW